MLACHRPRLVFICLLTLLAVLATGCAIDEITQMPLGGMQIDGKSNLDENGDDPDVSGEDVTEAALAEVEEFWSRTFEDVYGEGFEPVEEFNPYGPRSEPITCGPEELLYEEIAQNAFYCPASDLIAWDVDALIEPLYDQFGGFTVAIVFAHEYGHAIQARAVSPNYPTILLELQADCFAGAWVRDVEDGNSDSFNLSRDDLDASIAGFIQLRDGIGTEADDPAAHGTGFDRIGAFQDGLDNGAARCAEYENEPPDVFEFGFRTPNEFASGGNLPFEDVTPLTVDDLEAYWTIAFDTLGEQWSPVADVIPFDPDTDTVTCGDKEFGAEAVELAAFYCLPDDTVQFDNVNLMPELYDIGDFAMGFEIARQYAFAAQVRLGNTDDDVESELQADCLVGAYVASTIDGFGTPRLLSASPGDLDEAIISFLASPGAKDTQKTSAFERVAEFRRGVLGAGDLTVCDL